MSSSRKEGNPFYITTTLPYVNDEPHIGHVLEFVQADTIARFKRLEGFDVFFSTGTDEHGQKIWQKAQDAGRDVGEYVDFYAGRFDEIKGELNLSYDAFIRTTDEAHIEAAKEFWKRVEKEGDIYKKKYRGLYCVGCEAFVKESDLVDGKCPDHNKAPEIIEEENYFFRFSKYEQPLLDYLSSTGVIVPEWRREEAVKFVENGLEDFSISRSSERMPWGIEVPGDPEQVMYVWFEALVNYISTLGWPEDEAAYDYFWVKGHNLQMAGKDQIRFQSLMWQAMLMSAGLQPTKQVFYHGFINSGGVKMSKTLGNVINPFDVAREFGTDALRYYLLRHVHPTEDSDVTIEKIRESYNAHLANGLGNLVSRIMKMALDYEVEYALSAPEEVWADKEWDEYKNLLSEFEFNRAADWLWEGIGGLDDFISKEEPFKVWKSDPEKAREMVAYAVLKLYDIAVLLEPLLPRTSEKIIEALGKRVKPEALFERK